MTAELPPHDCLVCDAVDPESCPIHAKELPASLVEHWLHPRGYVAITTERLARLEEAERIFDKAQIGVQVCDEADLRVLQSCADMKPARVQYGKPGELGMSLHDAQRIYAAEMARRKARARSLARAAEKPKGN
jgi:hypothetical protein